MDGTSARDRLSAAKQELLRQRLKEHANALPTRGGIGQRRQANDLPLSYAQQRFFFLEQLEPNTPDHILPATLRMRGQLQLPALVESLNLLVQRHEILRTSFPTRQGVPVQHISPAQPLVLPLEDLSDLSAEQAQARLAELIAQQQTEPFELSGGALWRVALVRLAAEEHVLLVAMHHIITDGWSSSVLVSEVSQAYAALVQGKQPQLSELAIQYGDYAVWQQEWLVGEQAAQQMRYWREQLGQSENYLNLPLDRPRPVARTFQGGEYATRLPRDLVAELEQLSQQENGSLFMAMLAGYAILLARYCGQHNINIGTFHANRSGSEVERLIGYFLNVLVLRMDLTEELTAREVIRRARQVCLAAYRNKDLPFEKILEAVRPERDRGHAPLFQVMLVMQNLPDRTLRLPNLELQLIPGGSKRANVDLTLWLYETEQGLTASLEYNRDLFDQPTIGRLLEHYQLVLRAMLAQPDRPIRSFSLLTEQERTLLVPAWRSYQPLPQPANLASLFETQVERTPHAIALIDEHEQLTYLQLNARANRLARHLHNRGIAHEARVAIWLERSCMQVASILAVLKAGGVYIPIDRGAPPERVAAVLDDARPSLLIADQAPPGIDIPMPLLVLDMHWPQLLAPEREENLGLALFPQQAAYIIYTSGSTGRPKGVVGLHEAMVNRLDWMWHSYPFAADEMCCQKTSPGFVDAIAELFGPLLRGIPTVLPRMAISTDPLRLVELLQAFRVSRLVLVPSLLGSLLTAVPNLADRLPMLQLWISSGEALTSELAGLFQAVLPGRRLINLYGCSEVSADATMYEVGELPQQPGVPIGRPLPNIRVYVLDHGGQPAPIGVLGEIYLGGLGTNRGYLHQPVATAERFVPDSLSGEPGARLYRTGDLGRFLADGLLMFVGRYDHQVKIRGARVELGEVEQALQQLPAIQSAVVRAIAGSEGEMRLVAYVVLREGQSLNSGQLRRSLLNSLPPTMIPAQVVFLDYLPLTSSGKINREALPAPDSEPTEREGTYVAPSTPVEERLAAIWSAVLHRPLIGCTDNFFDLGGHSLSAIQVLSQIQQLFHVELSLQQFFEASTLADQALLVVQEQMKQIESDDLLKLLAEVTQLSVDEVQAALSAQQPAEEIPANG